eukprot:evm.model.scf_2460.1 EVM.evm.TU.scf_2460.1   scf_2460:19532-22155(+)
MARTATAMTGGRLRAAGVAALLSSVFLLQVSGDVERTLAIIKPDAVNEADAITDELEGAGFIILKNVRVSLSGDAVKQFYDEHKEKFFFKELVGSMVGHTMIVLVLEKENAVSLLRDLMGPTDPAAAQDTHPKSLRARYGKTITANALHGSDSSIAAEREIAYFFPSLARQSAPVSGEL